MPRTEITAAEYGRLEDEVARLNMGRMHPVDQGKFRKELVQLHKGHFIDKFGLPRDLPKTEPIPRYVPEPRRGKGSLKP